MTLKRFTELFIYLNSIGLIVHLFIGIGGRNSKGILPSLLSLDHRYIWFPISTYLFFFSLAGLTVLLQNHIEKIRNKPF
jgi:amino acid ABC-type transporter, permease component, putative